MKRITATAQIAIGLAGIAVTLLGIATYVKLVPDPTDYQRDHRAEICEIAAVMGSRYITQRELRGLETTLATLVARQHDLLSAGVRDDRGRLQISVADHAETWEPPATGADHESTETHVVVPLLENGRRWGQIEFRFQPFHAPGVLGMLMQRRVWLFLYFGLASTGGYYLFLRRVLQHLDPSKVVPGRVRSALDTLSEGLLMLDKNERIVLVNDAFSKLTGLSIDQLLGKKASSLAWVNRQDQDRGEAVPWLRLLRGERVESGQMLAFRSAEGVRSFQVNCSPILSGEGHRGVLVSLEDVTQLESTKVALARSRDEAEHANQAKSEFLARMSHEIRTPMNAILGFTDVLLRGLACDESETQDYLETIHTSGKHLLELINDILDLSKIEAGRLEVEALPCQPLTIITHAMTIMRVRAEEKGLTLSLNIEGSLPETIQSDETRLRQILMNLIGNAIKFTSQGGIRVQLACDSQAPQPMLLIDVIDSGIGISAEGLARIFDPFSQADNSITRRFGGTGLGLSISRRLAEALGGSLSVTSQEGQGSTFRVAIPTGPLQGVKLLDKHELTTDTCCGAKHKMNYHFRRGNILVADDGVSNRKLIQLVLSRVGLAVQCVENGAEAVELAMSDAFDVVFMDMQMPVMDGYTATSTLRSRGYERPIIALTANAMHGEEQKCRQAGCSGFLTKPIDMDKILATLATELGDDVLVTSAEESHGETERNGARQSGAGATGRTANLPATTPRAALDNIATVSLSDSGVKTMVIADRRSKSTRVPGREVSHSVAAERKNSGPPADSTSPPGATRTEELLYSTLPMDDECFVEIVVEFIERLADQIEAMEQAVAQEDFEELAKLAHWLKGSGGTTGFPQLSSHAAVLERSAKAASTTEVQQSLGELRRLSSRIVVPRAAGSPA